MFKIIPIRLQKRFRSCMAFTKIISHNNSFSQMSYKYGMQRSFQPTSMSHYRGYAVGWTVEDLMDIGYGTQANINEV